VELMSDLKRVLNCLSKKTLLELSQAFGYKGWIVLNKGEIVDRFAGDRSITTGDLLAHLKIPSLKTICQDFGFDARGSKGDLIGRILSVGKPDEPAPNKKTSTTRKESVVKTEADTQRSKQNRKRTVAIKKSELYSSLWSSCDELRGGMDASQYKDYVLVLLFIKYISDKYAGQPYAPIIIPKGANFKDMVALKGKPDIGDQINKRIIAPLANANKLSDMPDFNDATKLGSGKEMVEKLTNLIAIFENPALDFSKNRADGDDILGDAYEYLMRHFATESGKSKGQFYTPAEVSRIMAQISGIRTAKTTPGTTVYDPTCGSGSLLLKVADEARTKVTIYGQEKDATTAGLARMNMILHDNPEALIEQGNTLTNPKFSDGDTLKTFDYVVANPPFSDKRWGNGLDPLNDPYERFKPFGTPPSKQGDYAYLLHIVRSLKSTGKGACILPHGVLFRGNAEADIRRNLVRKGYIKGVIGLPANLFYGTGIPTCIVVVDKQDAHARKGIFMIDASAGFMKDGPKNRLRSQDMKV
jgi:type I restriction enzyme M protein